MYRLTASDENSFIRKSVPTRNSYGADVRYEYVVRSRSVAMISAALKRWRQLLANNTVVFEGHYASYFLIAVRMHTFLSRVNAVYAFALSVLAAATFGCFVSTFFKSYTAPVVILSSNPMVKNLPDYSAARERNDLGFLNFDIQADLSPLFDWNTKELFLYLTAEYQTKTNALNQVVLWDKIINRGDNPVVDIKSVASKYYFWDDGDGLKGHKNITLTLSWNVIPNAGRLIITSGIGSHSFAFPNEYTSSRLQ